MIPAWLTGAAGIVVGLLVYATCAGHTKLAGAAKMLASAGFVAVAAIHFDGGWHAAMLVAFALSLVGDALLLAKGNKRAFLAGLGSFLLAHLAFAGAFVGAGVSWAWFAIAAIPGMFLLMAVVAWLRPHVPLKMQPPVASYMVAITIMMLAAAAHVATGGRIVILAGALLFAASDLAVARERFVKPGCINRAWGLPTYYAGQYMLAWSLI